MQRVKSFQTLTKSERRLKQRQIAWLAPIRGYLPFPSIWESILPTVSQPVLIVPLVLPYSLYVSTVCLSLLFSLFAFSSMLISLCSLLLNISSITMLHWFMHTSLSPSPLSLSPLSLPSSQPHSGWSSRNHQSASRWSTTWHRVPDQGHVDAVHNKRQHSHISSDSRQFRLGHFRCSQTCQRGWPSGLVKRASLGLVGWT